MLRWEPRCGRGSLGQARKAADLDLSRNHLELATRKDLGTVHYKPRSQNVGKDEGPGKVSENIQGGWAGKGAAGLTLSSSPRAWHVSATQGFAD